MKRVAAAALLLAALEAWAQPAATPIRLALPLQCRIGVSCWVANYVDVDPGPGAADFRCGPRTYQEHDGVDFAIRDLGEMARGVPVLAAAAGTVLNVRDGVEDIALSDESSRERIANRECGNGVLLEHAGGWQTQYCHLRKGSVQVAPRQAVEAGTQLGLVGLSGQTVFPHVHLAVRYAGKPLDPFTGRDLRGGCGGEDAQGLWSERVLYETVALYNVGFAPAPPDADAIRRGERVEGPIAANAAALILWVDMLGVQAGDQVEFRIDRPDGSTLMDSTQFISRTQAQRLLFVGDRRRDTEPDWQSGVWTGEIIHRRIVAGTAVSTPVSVKQEVR